MRTTELKYFFGSKVSQHGVFAIDNDMQFVWCYSSDLEDEEIQQTKDLILRTPELRPDFVLVSFSTLESMINTTAMQDLRHTQNGGIGRFLNLPSKQRKRYGLLLDKIDSKYLKKTSTRALLLERQGYQVIPIDLKHIELCISFNINFCVLKNVSLFEK